MVHVLSHLSLCLITILTLFESQLEPTQVVLSGAKNFSDLPDECFPCLFRLKSELPLVKNKEAR